MKYITRRSSAAVRVNFYVLQHSCLDELTLEITEYISINRNAVVHVRNLAEDFLDFLVCLHKVGCGLPFLL